MTHAVPGIIYVHMVAALAALCVRTVQLRDTLHTFATFALAGSN